VNARNRSPVGRIFALMLLEQAVWSTATLLEIIAPTMQGKIIWDDLQFVLGGASAFLTLAFALRYQGTWFKGGMRTIALLLVFPFATWIFAATDPIHHLHRLGASIDPTVPFGELSYSFGIPMLLLHLPVYAVALAGITRLGVSVARFRGSRRASALLAFIGTVLPLSGTVITIIGIRINGRLDANALWLVAGDIFIGIGVFRYRLAGVLPIARKRIVDSLPDPVIVIDREDVVVDCNESIEKLLGMASCNLEGRKAGDVFSAWPQNGREVLSGRVAEAEIKIEASGSDIDFSIKAFPIVGETGARVVMLRDISALKSAEHSLRKLSLELEKKVEERVLDLEAEIMLRRAAEENLSGLNTELEKTRQEVMFTLSEIIENRGDETAKHVSRVSEYCRVLAAASGMSESEAEQLANASMMHDIGKIAIPDAILQSGDPLDAQTIEILRSHATIGSQILEKSDEPLIVRASRIALEHHERWDGTGYPAGKKGEEISLDARIVGICDVFDSLSTPRAYREEWEIDEVLRYFRTERGKSFDPALVETLFAELHVLLDIAAKYREDNLSDATVEAVP